jgi:predicted nucleotidyltransferase
MHDVTGSSLGAEVASSGGMGRSSDASLDRPVKHERSGMRAGREKGYEEVSYPRRRRPWGSMNPWSRRLSGGSSQSPGRTRSSLFGSAATGRMTRDSDIDLLVLEGDPGDRRKESVRLRSTLHGLGYPVDVIVISTEWFEESKGVVGGIAYPANKYGKVIYEAA